MSSVHRLAFRGAHHAWENNSSLVSEAHQTGTQHGEEGLAVLRLATGSFW